MTDVEIGDEGYRHIQCGQVTMPQESDIQEDRAFCVQCGRYFAIDAFLGVTRKHEDDSEETR